MKECPGCKTKNKNDAAFCMACGADLKDVPATTDELAAATGSLLNMAKEAAATGAKKAAEAVLGVVRPAQEVAQTREEKAQQAMDDVQERTQAVKAPVGGTPQKDSDILVDQSEQIAATIGSSYLQNFLSGGPVEGSIGILTQKRFYYKGRNFSGTGKNMTSTIQEGVVSIEDIAFTMFAYTRHIGLLVFAILLALAGLVVPMLGMRQEGAIVACALWVVSALFFAKYFVSRRSVFLVAFPGGSFGFDIRYYPISDIRDFQHQLHLIKDHIKENA